MNKTTSSLRYNFFFAIALFFLFIFFFLSLHIGSIHISFKQIFRILLFKQGTKQELIVLYKIRLPRALMAILLGGALALSGFLLQTYFQNPIAGPYVLGISSGSKLMVALTMVAFAKMSIKPSSIVFVLVAFLGAFLVTLIIIVISYKIYHIASLLVAGIMLGYINSAITDFVLALSDENNIINIHLWQQGSFSGMTMQNCFTAFVIIGLSFICIMIMAKDIDTYRLGESYAITMGVNVHLMRPMLIIFSSILSACVVAFAGPISFLGIAVPFFVKHCLNSSKPQILIPAVFLSGGTICLFCDILSRIVIAPSELNIGITTSIIGSPVVIFLLLTNRNKKL